MVAFNKKKARGIVVAAAMSGGVDSSVAAAILLEDGYDVVGVTMNLRRNDSAGDASESRCCSLEAAEDAYRVCRKLGIEHYFLDFRTDFEEYVVKHFAAEYAAGRTPNPCVNCNRYLKFEFLRSRVKTALNADKVATGHYARIIFDPRVGRHLLLKGNDTSKDQSYMLYSMTQAQLSETLFPVGEYSKADIRKKASELGLEVAAKPDSQEICFIPDNDYRRFLSEYIPDLIKPGRIVDLKGNKVGEHQGIAFYTIGQRRGIGSFGEKRYVVAINPQKNEVVVGAEKDLFKKVALASDINLIARSELTEKVRATAKIRYKMPEAEGLADIVEGILRFSFDVPQRAITPGQSLVIYEGEKVLGGGVICGSQ